MPPSAAPSTQADLELSYFNIMGLATSGTNGLQDIWNKPNLTINSFITDPRTGALTSSASNMSMWDAGKLFLVSLPRQWRSSNFILFLSFSTLQHVFTHCGFALQASGQDIWQNAYFHNSTVNITAGNTWRTWSSVSYLSSNMVALTNALFSTLDILVQVCASCFPGKRSFRFKSIADGIWDHFSTNCTQEVTDSAAQANQIQLTLLIIEGILCSVLVTAFVYYINSQVRRPCSILKSL